MILNAYAVLDCFLVFLRLVFGLLAFGLAAGAWRRAGASLTAEQRKELEDRGYLVFSLAVVLFLLNVVSWPLLYLVLQSYVPEWSGVMCIYGVTRIGTGSLGPSRFLPGLLDTLQALKPVLVFVSGAWFVLYLINRRTRTAPLTRRLLVVAAAVGLLAVADAAAEGAYLVIPKKGEFASGGCCALAFDTGTGPSGVTLQSLLGRDYQREVLSRAYYVVNGVLILGLAAALWLGRLRAGLLPALVLVALISVPVNAVYLMEVAAPVLLGLPDHHCPYDLIPEAPESLLAVALHFLGIFSVGWTWIAKRLADTEETRPFLDRQIGTILTLGLFGYAGSLVMMGVEMALART